ncbi:MAG: HEAT repeat domain-containing protein [Planctomycetes bacterium]|nr:HEAT repeat domain-containing protein [Planctomycetota bacterium]
MKKLILLGSLLALGSLCLQDISTGHGGSYRGPGDTVPPGGGGGGGGGTGPSTPGPSGPSTGGPSGPSGPAAPGAGPATGAGTGSRPTGPATGGAISSGPDLSTWEFWWGFNKDQYLQLKAAIYDGGQVSGSDSFWLGQGTSGQNKNALKPSEEAIRTKIVPALKEALEKERSNDIVTGALIALGKIGDVKSGDDGSSEFEPIIAKFLSDSNQEIAETAAVALGILANDASVKVLSQLALDDEVARKLVGKTEVNWRTRAFATYGLGLIGNRTAKNEVRQEIARTLIEILQRPDNSTRDIKVAAIISLGLCPIDVDRSEAPESKSDNSASRQTQIKYLKRFFTDNQEHYLVRAHVPGAMAKLLQGAPDKLREEIAELFADQIAQFAKEKKKEIHQSCVLALGQIGDCGSSKLNENIRKSLTRFMDDGDTQSRNFAAIAMAQIGGRGKGEEFEKGRQEVRNLLLKKLTDGKSHIKPWAGVAVGVMERAVLDDGQTQSAAAKETLREVFRDAKSPGEVGAYAIGLGIAKDIEAKGLVLAKMKDTSEQFAKGYLCVSLGLIGSREALPDIQTVVRDSKFRPDLLKQAAIGLGLLGDKDLVPELIKMLEEAKSLASQASLASALGFIGDSRSIDPLVAMLKKSDITATARGFAAVALGIVADKELLPWNSKISTNINYLANTTTLTGDSTGILDIL